MAKNINITDEELMRDLINLNLPNNGEIYFDDEDTGHSEEFKKRMKQKAKKLREQKLKENS